MPLKRRIAKMSVAVAVGVGILVGSIWSLTKLLGDRTPVYEGRTLYFWAGQISSGNTTASNQANAVLVKDIVPQLSEVMLHDTNDSNLRLALVDKLNGLPGVNIYFTPAHGRRARAAADMGEFGPAASPAIPTLLRALKGSDAAVQGPALTALGRIHSQPDIIVPLLISYLDNSNLNEEAAEALGNFGNAAMPAVPKLTPMLEIRDKGLHHAVVEALKKIDSQAPAAAGVK